MIRSMKNFKSTFAILSLIALCVGCTSAKASAPSDPAQGSCIVVTSDAFPDLQAAFKIEIATVDFVVSDYSDLFVQASPIAVDKTSCIVGEIEASKNNYSVRSPHTGFMKRCYYASLIPDRLSAGFAYHINAPPKIG
jgi:hypothetical protein